MSRRLWGACASEQGLLETALGPRRLALHLDNEKTGTNGWGIGFYENGEPLVRKSPKETRRDVDLLGVIAETRSDLLIGHVREATVGSLRAENTHPFRYRNWLFAHSGTIRMFKEIKAQMLETMPTFLFRSLGGDTDSEVFFHVMLSFLHDSRRLDDPRLNAEVVAEALIKALTMTDELESAAGISEPSDFNVILSNGNCLVGLHRSKDDLRYRLFETPGRDGIRPRAVLIGCAHATLGEGWISMPDRSVLKISRELEMEVTAF
jgi:predicted glutamine amidotransferase